MLGRAASSKPAVTFAQDLPQRFPVNSEADRNPQGDRGCRCGGQWEGRQDEVEGEYGRAVQVTEEEAVPDQVLRSATTDSRRLTVRRQLAASQRQTSSRCGAAVERHGTSPPDRA